MRFLWAGEIVDVLIQNIYYLLCYAWNRLEEGQFIDVSEIPSNNLPNLFASVLIGGVNRLIKDGFDRGYVEVANDVRCIKGKIAFGETVRRNLVPQAMAHCIFDELTHDVIHNQILKATLNILKDTDALDIVLHTKIVWALRRMDEISDIHLNRLAFRRLQLHRNNGFYVFLMNICELVHDSLLIDENAGNYRFKDFFRDPEKMWRLFQDFVRNFYKLEQSEYDVGSDQFKWIAEGVGTTDVSMLPRLETDITLRKRDKVLIIDTKYYPEALAARYEDSKPKIKRDHLFQLFAYLKNCPVSSQTVGGILLYPAVGQPLDLHFSIHGHAVRVYTINLASEWNCIKQDLISLLH